KTREEAAIVAAEMLSGKILGAAGSPVVLEECLEGEELSFLVISDGERIAALAAAQDHKRIGEGDTGPNTGGMGAYSAENLLDAQMREWLLAHVARPTMSAIKAEGAQFPGGLYAGLILPPPAPLTL